MKNKSYLLNLVAVLSLTFANLGAEVACWGLFYQPEMPKRLRK
ncbi:hypothetical protein CIW83_04535 [Tissierella sp. P1]|nr:cyclic lactone autoinducer peptide [Tissierella sp. P1]MDU5080291.1 cyclic lactone autoinducer peptide [Bacillota bacterium]OZV13149.1 hypothetical protein CIW83_04535 [Tissierella sp. P1]